MVVNRKNLIGGQQYQKDLKFFGTDGIRGDAEELLNTELVQKLGFLCSQVLAKDGPILIGQDSRTSSQRISYDLTFGLNSTGKEVWLLGICPTPTIPLLIRKHKASGGLMISASHNQPKDNGIKIFDSNGEKISSDKENIIENRLQEKVVIYQNKKNYINRYDLLQDYEDSLIQTVGQEILKDVPIVLDLCWGSATACSVKVFQSLGAKVTSINASPDGRKINVNCGSTHLKNIKKAVLETKAEMGFAFDGDADRMIAIDRKGRVMDGDHILYLWGSSLKEENLLPEQRLVSTVMSNLGFEKAWCKKGGQLERTPVGDKHVHQAMVKTKASLGGEQSGHILSKLNNLCGDGLLTSLQIAGICKKKGIYLSNLLDQSFTPYPQELMNIAIDDYVSNEYIENSERFQKLIEKAKLDLGEDSRIFIRKSGTESLLRVMIESTDKVSLKYWISAIGKKASEEFN